MKGAHFLFNSQEPAYKMTFNCWLDTRKVDAVYFAARAGTHFTYGYTEALERERSLILISKMLNVAYTCKEIKASFNQSTNASFFCIVIIVLFCLICTFLLYSFIILNRSSFSLYPLFGFDFFHLTPLALC